MDHSSPPQSIAEPLFEVPSAGCPKRRIRFLNDPQSFGLGSRALHWATAVLVAAVFPLGFYCASLARTDPVRESLLSIHKSLGVAIIAVVLLRLFWNRFSRPTPPAQELKPWEARLARLTHSALYLSLIAVPMSGMLLSLAAGHDVSFFGLFEVPQFVPIDSNVPVQQRPAVIAGAILHKALLTKVLLALIALHLAGAAKHHWIDGHRSAIRRMWGFPRER